MLYRHFVRGEDGAICEIEESLPFTVDDYPLLERWPERSRKFAGDDDSKAEKKKEREEKDKNQVEEGEPMMRTAKCDVSGMSVSDASFLEPQVILVKNE